MWLSWSGVIPQSQRLQVQFPVRAHSWVVGSVHSLGDQCFPHIDVSPSPFLPPFPLSKNTYIKSSTKKKRKERKKEEKRLTSKMKHLALAGVAQWISASLKNQRVAGSIPSQDTCQVLSRGCARGNDTLMFFSISFSFPSL